VATPVTLVRVSAGHSRTLSAGQTSVGGVVSLTMTLLAHVFTHLLLVTVSVNMNSCPQRLPDVTVTVD
jgi:hypothetical protein